nr:MULTISPECIES: PIN domain-containing protein [unclassified Variovorax]
MRRSPRSVLHGTSEVSEKLALERGATFYLDTNPIIYLTEGNPLFKKSIAALFKSVEAAGAHLITSELALTEVLVRPIRQNDTELIATYERLFDTLVDARPVSREVLLLAAQLRADLPSLKTPDAIHVATATLAEADAFVSGDLGLRGLPSTMRRITL